MKIQIFDPPMCCSTGVCGPSVDPELVRFASDVDWLARRGAVVERYNLSQQPAAFVDSAVVKDRLAREGHECLPLIVAEGVVLSTGRYPKRQELAGFAGLEVPKSLFTDEVRELVAIGAAIASNCEPCFKHHFNEARKLGISKEDIRLAVEMAQAVKETPARSVLDLAGRHLREPSLEMNPCCGAADDAASSPKCC